MSRKEDSIAMGKYPEREWFPKTAEANGYKIRKGEPWENKTKATDYYITLKDGKEYVVDIKSEGRDIDRATIEILNIDGDTGSVFKYDIQAKVIKDKFYLVWAKDLIEIYNKKIIKKISVRNKQFPKENKPVHILVDRDGGFSPMTGRPNKDKFFYITTEEFISLSFLSWATLK